MRQHARPGIQTPQSRSASAAHFKPTNIPNWPTVVVPQRSAECKPFTCDTSSGVCFKAQQRAKELQHHHCITGRPGNRPASSHGAFTTDSAACACVCSVAQPDSSEDIYIHPCCHWTAPAASLLHPRLINAPPEPVRYPPSGCLTAKTSGTALANTHPLSRQNHWLQCPPMHCMPVKGRRPSPASVPY